MIAAGTGRAGCHHGEILQGVFTDERGRPQHGLLTLPLAEPATRAEFVPDLDATPDGVTVVPGDRAKALRAAREAITVCAGLTGQTPRGGRVRLHGHVPVGLGMGSSTSDVVATIRAVAAGYGIDLTPDRLARLAVDVEQASDPLMLQPRPLLFAQRRGHVLEALGTTLPPAVVLGCLTGQGRPVDTLAVSADHDGDTADLRWCERLRAMARTAIAEGDVGLLGRVSTASARRHHRILPTPELDTLTRVAAGVGAAGVQIAHSGNVAGLLFDSRDPAVARRVRQAGRALESNGLPPTGTFTTRPGQPGRRHGRAHHAGDRARRPDPGRRGAGVPAL